MRLMPIRSARNGYVLLTLLLLAVVAAPLVIPGATETVFARRYGSYHKNYGAIYAKYIARCKAKCGQTVGAISACIAHEKKLQAGNCRQLFKADKALCTDQSCVRDKKSQLKFCLQKRVGSYSKYDHKTLGDGARKCPGCCQRSKGQGDCTSYFQSSRFYGSYRYKGHLNCAGSHGQGGGSQGGDCEKRCEAVAAQQRTACGGDKRAARACLGAVAEALQACVTQCHAHGSPSAAFLGDLPARIRAHVASWLPWLVRGWTD